MDQDSVERIRGATFSHARRGYDPREVDGFLAELADWLETGGGDEARSDLLRGELARIGEQTGAILTDAHDVAATMREEAELEVRRQLAEVNLRAEAIRGAAEEYADETRGQAEAHSRRVRSEADEYEATTRAETDEQAEATRAAASEHAANVRAAAEATAAEAREQAEREAERIVADATKRKRDIESVISDLEERHDAVVAELERLASGITGAAQHRAGEPHERQGEDEGETEDSETEPETARAKTHQSAD